MTTAFRAMNTDVILVAPGVRPVRQWWFAHQARRTFARSEARFSRFRPDSELSRLNRDAGSAMASAELFAALQRARAYWESTDGWFDPSIGPALCRAGYDRSFAPGRLDGAARAADACWHSAMSGLVLDGARRRVGLPAGAALDFGGFIKGWTVDRVSTRLPAEAAVNAGGDAYLRGSGPGGSGWQVRIEDPWVPGRALLSLAVRNRAVATSGINRRRWRVGGQQAHHLIDPRTGRPSASDLLQVTVVTRCAELADVLAKTALLRGATDGARFLEGFAEVSAVFIGRDASPLLIGEFDSEFCEVIQ